MKIITLIFLTILLLVSCEPNNKNSPKPIVLDSNQEVTKMSTSAIANCSAKNDTLFEELEYGTREIISLGEIKVDSAYFEVKTIFARLEMADGFRGRSWLLLESSTTNTTFCYDASMPDDLPCCIVEDKLLFKNGCESRLSEIKEEILCFYCSNMGCFMYEYNPLEEVE